MTLLVQKQAFRHLLLPNPRSFADDQGHFQFALLDVSDLILDRPEDVSRPGESFIDVPRKVVPAEWSQAEDVAELHQKILTLTGKRALVWVMIYKYKK